MTVTISCAGDADLATKLHNHLLSTLSFVNPEAISLKDDEIYVDLPNLDSKDTVLKRISEFIGSDPSSHYQMNELDGIIAIGTPASHKEMMESILTCDMCNYMTAYEEQLRLHRMTHGMMG